MYVRDAHLNDPTKQFEEARRVHCRRQTAARHSSQKLVLIKVKK
jgi:hypothetical protein